MCMKLEHIIRLCSKITTNETMKEIHANTMYNFDDESFERVYLTLMGVR